MLRPPVEPDQYLSLAYADRLIELGIAPSVGSRGDSYDNALAEAVNAAYKTEVINRGKLWRGVDGVELATAEWVAWYNQERLHDEPSWSGWRPSVMPPLLWRRRCDGTGPRAGRARDSPEPSAGGWCCTNAPRRRFLVPPRPALSRTGCD